MDFVYLAALKKSINWLNAKSTWEGWLFNLQLRLIYKYENNYISIY